jgi:hypothetical protein
MFSRTVIRFDGESLPHGLNGELSRTLQIGNESGGIVEVNCNLLRKRPLAQECIRMSQKGLDESPLMVEIKKVAVRAGYRFYTLYGVTVVGGLLCPKKP